MKEKSTTGVHKELQCYFPEETLALISGYMEGIGSEHDRRARERIFADFFMVTGRDLLHAEVGAFERYAGVLRNRIADGRIKLNTALKNQRVLSAFASYVMKEKAKGNSNVPAGYEDRTLTSRIEEPPEAIYFRDVPSLLEIDRLAGVLKERDDMQTLAAVFLAYKCFLKTSEISGLKKADIMSDASGATYISVGLNSVPIRIPEDVAGVLDSCLANLRGGEYVISRKGRRITQAALQKRIRSSCGNAGIPVYTLNALRNAGVATAIGAGADAVKLCDDMRYRNRAHIRRLTSLPIKIVDVSGYVNICVR